MYTLTKKKTCFSLFQPSNSSLNVTNSTPIAPPRRKKLSNQKPPTPAAPITGGSNNTGRSVRP